MKRKFFALFLTVCTGVMLMSGCGSAPAAEQPQEEKTAEGSAEAVEAELETIVPGKLTVATSPDFAPFEFYSIDRQGNTSLAGFDIALAQYIADTYGLELEIVTVDFDGVLAALEEKSVDLGVSGLSPDPAREGIMDFSAPYYFNGQSLVTTKTNAGAIKSFEDVNKPEFVIGAQTGSIQLDLANTYTPEATIVSRAKVTDIISELVEGKEYAAFMETDVAKCYKNNHPQLELVLEVPYDQEGLVVGVSKGNDKLLNAVNAAIETVVEEGLMEEYVAEANKLAAGKTYEGLLEDKE